MARGSGKDNANGMPRGWETVGASADDGPIDSLRTIQDPIVQRALAAIEGTSPDTIILNKEQSYSDKETFNSAMDDWEDRGAPFDHQQAESFNIRQLQIGTVIEDDDPNPDDIRKVIITTPFGQYLGTMGGDGYWSVAGRNVGPNIQRACDFARAVDSQM